MPLLPILTQAGPLPIATSFNAPMDGPAWFTLTGSVWTQTANQMIGVILELDGQPIGSAQIFSNGASTHRAVIPVQIPVNLTFGTHKITLVALNTHTTTDFNDSFNVSLSY
jgi:hypothetical protein